MTDAQRASSRRHGERDGVGAVRALLLMRHGKAEQGNGTPDVDRELATRGRRDALAAGRWLAAHLEPLDLVVCSSSVRTRQTWQAMTEGGAEAAQVWHDRRVYNADERALLAVLQELPEDARSVLLLGHAPGVPRLAGLLTGDPALVDDWSTSGLAVLSCSGGWAGAGPRSALLRDRVTPRG